MNTVTIKKEKKYPSFFGNMKFLLMNEKPAVQVSQTYLDVTSRTRNHRILNPKPERITPGIYITKKNLKNEIVLQEVEEVYPTPVPMEGLNQDIKQYVPSLGLSSDSSLPKEFERLMVLPFYGDNTARYRKRFEEKFSQYLSSSFNQVITESDPLLIDVELLRDVIEVPARAPGWSFRFINSKAQFFCFVAPHEFDFRLALVAPLKDLKIFKEINEL